MKRTMMLVLVGLAAVAWVGQAGIIERLERMATTDLFPEVRAAAAVGLAQLWVTDDIPNEDLEEIATSGATEEVRSAAAQALAARLVDAADTEALAELAASHPLDAVRQRSGAALSEQLLAARLPLAELEALARDGDSAEARQAAVAALAQVWQASGLANEALLAQANDGQTAALRAAAAAALLARLTDELVGLDEATLVDLAAGGMAEVGRVAAQQNAPLRQAAAARLIPFFQDGATPVSQVEAIAADPDNSIELRGVASDVLLRRLLRENRTLGELEALAGQGATPEVQAAAVTALEEALVTAVGQDELSAQALVDSLSDVDSDALNQARANAVFTLMRPNLIFLTDQPLLEAILRGETVEIDGVVIDGANLFIQHAASDFLAGIFLQFGAINRFDDPLAELLAMAGDPDLALGFRLAAEQALVKFLASRRDTVLSLITDLKRMLDRIVIQGRRGQAEEALALLEEVRQALDENTALINTTSEAAGDLGSAQRLRSLKEELAQFPDAIRDQDTSALRDINNFVSGELSQIEVGVAGAPDTSLETLRALAQEAATPELRRAAAAVLADRLSADQAAGEADLASLLTLAREGASEEARGAAVEALVQALLASDQGEDELLALIEDGETAAVQLAAASAWLVRQAPGVERATELANGSGVDFGRFNLQVQSSEFSDALADAVLQRWIDIDVGSVFLLDQIANAPTPRLQRAAAGLLTERLLAQGRPEDELIELAANDDNPLIRQAAAEALTQVLVALRLSEAQLFGLVSQYTLATDGGLSSPELAHAITLALADRFLNPLIPVPDPGNRVELGSE